MHDSSVWRLCIDTGGTFTDCLALDPQGREHRAKVLSTGALRATIVESIGTNQVRLRLPVDAPDDFFVGAMLRRIADSPRAARIGSFDARRNVVTTDSAAPMPTGLCEIETGLEAPVLAAHLVTRTPLNGLLPPMQLRLATTRGTNALLERRGGPTALLITAGFADLIRIGTQQRPDLFAIDILKPQPLHDAVVEVREQIDAGGLVLAPVDLDHLRDEAARLAARGISAAAVALKNAWLNDEHERTVEAVLREAGFESVTRSSAAAPLMRLLPRAETALVDAYLAPIIRGYIGRIGERIEADSIKVMTSAGGLAAAKHYRPCDSLLSGPAGGIAGAAAVARATGEQHVISFDMGGTSTDVARWAGEFEYDFEHHVGDARLLAPALSIESVAAGGGSVCWFDGHRLRVGPHSAGAAPGPACYGCGGPLTITDVNLLLGRVDERRFQTPLDHAAAVLRCEQLLTEVRRGAGEAIDETTLLTGLLAIANAHMADAIARISLRRGLDPAEHTLIAFGGAGGQHACAIADRLGMNRVIAPADAGLLSAAGLFDARVERFAQRQVLRPLDDVSPHDLAAMLADLDREAIELVERDCTADEPVEIRRRLAEMRVLGQDSTLTVEITDLPALGSGFAREHQRIFGYGPPGRIELESLRVIASTPAPQRRATPHTHRHDPPPATRAIHMRFDAADTSVPIIDREAFVSSSPVPGPALLVDDHSTTLVEPGWTCRRALGGHIIIERSVAATQQRPAEQAPTGDAINPIRLELFTNRFRGIVQDMGELLRRTAQSTNVKERLDFSCALLDAEARLVANAPHIPVHLGAMGCCVRAVRDAIALKPGDVAITNHPAFGGSHLPDITLITPVFDGDALLGYVANRAHHAEIGGTRPGSMPPAARTLAEEGVVIPPMLLARGGVVDWPAIRALLEDSPHPSRQVEMNLADLAAALAANRHGAEMLRQLARTHGPDVVAAFMAALRSQAADTTRQALAHLGDRVFHAAEQLDDGSALEVSITTRGGRAVIDFTGSCPTHAGNLNATPAIVHSAVMYVLRLLVGRPLPLNEGLLESVSMILPEDTILNPRFSADPARCPAVVGGNTETSQRLVDTLIKALGLAACSQGTMNNVLFGNERFGYYETICGGAGASEQREGADAVHTHMTNTRITDVEVLEHRYPVRVRQFAIRRASGGLGRHRGGDGVVREIEFLEPVALSVLTQHRTVPPFGCAGGESGACGRQSLIRTDSAVVELASIDGCDAKPGDRLIIETPGGGGWGKVT
ncbi:MAG: hydantoinase B/oxoprolinase family protein [Phycisphaerales bacterium]|nr:hydantoinase B/oxoprolinase family protein [Phycisphaerales bacterium]